MANQTVPLLENTEIPTEGMRMAVTIYFQEDRAFVKASKTHLLCIGSREEIEGAEDHKITRAIQEAIAYNIFYGIETSVGHVVH